jgi:hypothetical protein
VQTRPHPLKTTADQTTNDPRTAWFRLARKVARRVNLAWWLDAAAIPLVVLGLAGACAMLLVRHHLPEARPEFLALGTLGAVGLLALGAWIFIRRRFETPTEALVRIEASMHLRNRLSAAMAGVAPWPEPPESVDAGLHWRWSRLVIPPLAALACLAAGMFVPVSARSDADSTPQEPLAWQEIENDLDLLEEQNLADKPYIEETRKKLEELRKQDPEDWFNHSSLEAGDTLRRTHRAEVQRVTRELTQTERSLSALSKAAKQKPGLTGKQRKQLSEQLGNAMKGLRQGALKPNPALMKQLSQLDPSQLGQLDPAQLKQLREALAKCAKGFGQCQGAGEMWGEGLCQGKSPGNSRKNGDKPGRGGVTRGPGTTKAVLGPESQNLKTGELAGVQSKDLSNALPGTLLQIEDTEHDADKSPVAPSAGGAISSTGRGGERVWRESLDPDEQRVVKRFFNTPPEK